MVAEPNPHPSISVAASPLELLQCLPTLPPELRARALATLLASDQPDIRRRAVAIASAVLGDDEIESYLRDGGDAVLRNGGLEALKLRGRRGTRLAQRLLDDRDPEVVLQAVLVLTHGRDPVALEDLRRVLAHRDPNVVQAAIVGIGQIGDERFEVDVIPFLKADSWVQMAAIQTLGDLGTAAAIPHLRALVDHPLIGPMIGPMAAEAIARIGGEAAFRLLCERWLATRTTLPELIPTTLLAYVADALTTPPPRIPGLRQALESSLATDDVVEACAAAHVLLGLGPGPGDLRSVGILARHRATSRELPRCLARRDDLTPVLLLLPGAPRCWGLALAARQPDSVGFTDLKIALAEVDPDTCAPAITSVLISHDDPRLAPVAAQLFARASAEGRRDLAPAVRHYAGVLRPALGLGGDDEATAAEPRGPRAVPAKSAVAPPPEAAAVAALAPVTRVLLAALLGAPEATVAAAVAALPEADRPEAVAGLGERPDVVAALPWREWMEADPSRTCSLLAAALEQAPVPGAAELLERTLRDRPDPTLIRAVASLGAERATQVLAPLLDHPSQIVRVLALDTLGNIGDRDSRALLRHRVRYGDPSDVQVALRALARAPEPADLEAFLEAAEDRNPALRLIAAEVLTRLPDPSRLPTLVALAADPDERVAARATAGLAASGETR